MAFPTIKGVASCCWRTEIEIDLIEEVKKRNHLWDPKNPLYVKKSVKKATYTELAEILKQRWPLVSVMFTGDSVNRKFANLRSYYTKECKKLKDLKSISGGVDFHPKWYHFSRLSFLQDVVVIHENGSVTPEDSVVTYEDSFVIDEANSIVVNENSISSLNDLSSHSDTELEVGFNTEAEVSSIKVEPLELPEPSDSAFEVSSISSNKEPERLPVEERKNMRTTRHSEDVNLETRNCTQTVKQNYDAEYFYGRFIACQLREIQDPMQRDLAKIEIQRVLMKYKYGVNT